MLAIIMVIADEQQRSFVENIYVQYSKKMYVIANKVLNKHEDAEDCVHDVIKIIIDNIERFQEVDENGLKRLLVICTRNAAINRYNANKRKGVVSLTLSGEDNERDEFDVCDTDADVVQIIINEQNAILIHKLVDQLEERYRDVIVLRYFHRLSYEEIARFMGIAEANIRMRVTRAKRKLLELGGKELYDSRIN